MEIADRDEPVGPLVLDASWEGLVIENVIAAMPGWRPSFYRTQGGAEIDLVLTRGRRRLAIECKASAAPKVSRGFWSALEDVDTDEPWIIAPVDEPCFLRDGVQVAPLGQSLGSFR